MQHPISLSTLPSLKTNQLFRSLLVRISWLHRYASSCSHLNRFCELYVGLRGTDADKWYDQVFEKTAKDLKVSPLAPHIYSDTQSRNAKTSSKESRIRRYGHYRNAFRYSHRDDSAYVGSKPFLRKWRRCILTYRHFSLWRFWIRTTSAWYKLPEHRGASGGCVGILRLKRWLASLRSCISGHFRGCHSVWSNGCSVCDALPLYLPNKDFLMVILVLMGIVWLYQLGTMTGPKSIKSQVTNVIWEEPRPMYLVRSIIRLYVFLINLGSVSPITKISAQTHTTTTTTPTTTTTTTIPKLRKLFGNSDLRSATKRSSSPSLSSNAPPRPESGVPRDADIVLTVLTSIILYLLALASYWALLPGRRVHVSPRGNFQ